MYNTNQIAKVDLQDLKIGDMICMRYAGDAHVLAIERALGNSYEVVVRNIHSGLTLLITFTRGGWTATKYRREDILRFYTPARSASSQSASRGPSFRRVRLN